MIAGIQVRTQGFQPHQRKACLNAAPIFLSARAGMPVPASNRDGFDLIRQLAPERRLVHH